MQIVLLFKKEMDIFSSTFQDDQHIKKELHLCMQNRLGIVNTVHACSAKGWEVMFIYFYVEIKL